VVAFHKQEPAFRLVASLQEEPAVLANPSDNVVSLRSMTAEHQRSELGGDEY
jgi:hypothetical protein